MLFPSRYFAAVVLIASLLGHTAQADEPVTTAFITAEAEFHAAVAGQSGATERSLKHFEELSATPGPLQALYQTYLGSTQALQGRDAWMPWTKLKATEKGLGTIDKVLGRLDATSDRTLLREVPISLEIRLIAAATFLAVPDQFFHRSDLGRQILDELMRHPRLAATPAVFRTRVFQQAAISAHLRKDRQNEITLLRQAIATGSGGPEVAACQHRLQELGA